VKGFVLRIQFGKAGDRDGRSAVGDDLLDLGDLFVNQGIQCGEPLFQVAAGAGIWFLACLISVSMSSTLIVMAGVFLPVPCCPVHARGIGKMLDQRGAERPVQGRGPAMRRQWTIAAMSGNVRTLRHSRLSTRGHHT